MEGLGGSVTADPAAFGMSSLPEQHEDQLALGFRMIQNAYNSKVQNLEQELRGLRLSYEEQKNQATTLQRKNSALEVELVEGHQKAQQLAEENKELFKTVQQLRRQLQRLEGLKKRVLDSINDEALAGGAIAGEPEDSRLYMRDDYLAGALPATIQAMQGDSFGFTAPGGSGRVSGTAPVAGGAGQPEPYRPGSWEPPAGPPQPASVPTEPLAAGGGGIGGGGIGPIDGKQFFRQARNSLSYEAFNEFLANIKRLNNQQQSRETTLEEARRIFGPEQTHLYQEFEQLLEPAWSMTDIAVSSNKEEVAIVSEEAYHSSKLDKLELMD
eukprot:CAMPEP_0197657094 /NCGR_PEP_ID=MMETSP1338-20131121/44423_1 /TAXON_ID=43686 ORGANISM="Pelagodinium beii, Strain RCC1491" /NCGR_SAMPLE_ID=MMETSP1338 /ASSEMBLY_ACC=CAM_ASM_000754 /LENGTH=325 /DNA_ID=CAMNT_0043233395 /DNA_START=45 /DNA_END=1019 /DNA_ORIENTATION=-